MVTEYQECTRRRSWCNEVEVILQDDFSIWCFSVEDEWVLDNKALYMYLCFMFLYSEIKFMNFVIVLCYVNWNSPFGGLIPFKILTFQTRELRFCTTKPA